MTLCLVRNENDGWNWTLVEPYDPPFAYPKYVKWGTNQPNAPQGFEHFELCSALNIKIGEEDKIHDVNCFESNFCQVCRFVIDFSSLFCERSGIFRFTDVSYFKIRGTCPALADILDQDYVIDTEKLKESIENGITFLGITGYARTTIELDDDTKKWTVFDNKREKMMFIDYQVMIILTIF